MAEGARGGAALPLSLARRGRGRVSSDPEASSPGDPGGDDPGRGRTEHHQPRSRQGGGQDPGEHAALGGAPVLGCGDDGQHGAEGSGSVQDSYPGAVQGVLAPGGGEEVRPVPQPAAAAHRGAQVPRLGGAGPEPPRVAAREGPPQRPLRHPAAGAGDAGAELRVQRRQRLLLPPAQHHHLDQESARHPGEDRQAGKGGREERRQRHPGISRSYPRGTLGLDRAADAGLSLPP